MFYFDLGEGIVGGQYFYAAQTAAFQPPSGGCYKDPSAHLVELIKVVVSLNSGPCIPSVTELFPPCFHCPVAVLLEGAVWVGGRRGGWGTGRGRAKAWDEEEAKPKGRSGAARGIDAPACFSGPV